MKFATPWCLTLLVLLPLWLWREQRLASRGGLKYSSVASARAAGSFWAGVGPTLLMALRGATLALFVIALARPQVGRSESKVRTEGIDIVLAVDISGSMQALDYQLDGKPADRITVVKKAVRDFIKDRPNDRIGMVVFAGRAYVASPLTLDHDWLDRNLDRVRIGLIEDGTALGSGLGTAVNRLRDTKAKSKVVILLTDGVNNVWTVQPSDAAKAAREFGVRVYTIGAGSNGDAPMPVYERGGRLLGYQTIHAELDEELLKQIATSTGGQYFRAADTEALRNIYQQIDRMEKRQIETVKYEDWRELFPWFLMPGLGCLLVAVGLENTRLRRIP
jgi:Ca-activated chloride channel family protein